MQRRQRRERCGAVMPNDIHPISDAQNASDARCAGHRRVIGSLMTVLALVLITYPTIAHQDAGTESDDQPAPQASDEDIRQWIQQLGSTKYHERESAAELLSSVGALAVDQLADEAVNPNSEIAWRATELLEEIALNGDEQLLVAVAAKLQALSATGRTDLIRRSNSLRQVWKQARSERTIATLQGLGARIETHSYAANHFGGPVFVGGFGGGFGAELIIEEDFGDMRIEDFVEIMPVDDDPIDVLPLDEPPKEDDPAETARPVDEGAEDLADATNTDVPVDISSDDNPSVRGNDDREAEIVDGSGPTPPRSWNQPSDDPQPSIDNSAADPDSPTTAVELIAAHRRRVRHEFAVAYSLVVSERRELSLLGPDVDDDDESRRSATPISDGQRVQPLEFLDEDDLHLLDEQMQIEVGRMDEPVFGGARVMPIADIAIAEEMIFLDGFVSPPVSAAEGATVMRYVTIDANWTGTPEHFQLLQEIDQIRSLTISDQEISADMLVEIAMLESLESVSFVRCRFDTESMKALSRIRTNVAITTTGAAYLGVTADLTNEGAFVGCRIETVMDQSGAQRAGILVGDNIIRIGRHAVTDFQTLTYAIAGLPVGSRVEIEVERNGKRLVARVELGPRP